MNTICFGQQPCGFFPKRFFVAKINTARALQKEIGGKIVFFYHDSDADYRETITIFHDRQTNAEVRLNFLQENKLQKKFSPLALKRVPLGWKEEILKQLPRFLPPSSPTGRGQGEGLIEIFKSVEAKTVADFCLEMYKKMGLLDGIDIVRSSDKNFREQASELTEYFADLDYQGEVVRAKIQPSPTLPFEKGGSMEPSSPFLGGRLGGVLHEGGDKFIRFPIDTPIQKSQKSPARDERFAWMNSVIHCTHYVAGNSEFDYLKKENFPEVQFVKREQIENSEFAFIPS